MLFGTKHFTTLAQLRSLLNGTPITGARGTKGTNGAGSANITVPVASGSEGDFSDLSVGDRLIITGEVSTTVFLIDTKNSDQDVDLDSNIVNAHAGNAVWRAVKDDAIPIADIQFGAPISDSGQAGAGFIVYALP